MKRPPIAAARGRLARRLRGLERIAERLDRRSPPVGEVSAEFMRLVDRVVVGDPQGIAAAAPSERPGRSGSTAAPATGAPKEHSFTGN